MTLKHVFIYEHTVIETTYVKFHLNTHVNDIFDHTIQRQVLFDRHTSSFT